MQSNEFQNYHLDNHPQHRRVPSGPSYQQRPCWQLDSFKDSIYLKMNNEMAIELLNTISNERNLDPVLADIICEIKNFVGIKQTEVVLDDKIESTQFVIGRFKSSIFVVMTHITLKSLCDVLNSLSTVILSSTYSLKQKAEKILYQPPTPNYGTRPNYYDHS